MEAALYDPEHGYYCAPGKKRWGRAGDYRTSPERSVLFSATFARFFTQLQQDLSGPTSWTIFECGAGEGQFAANCLNALDRQSRHVFELTDYVIDELSSASRTRISNHAFEHKVRFERIAEAAPFVGVVFANELLDAFPVHRVMMEAGTLREFYVGVKGDGSFVWQTGPLSDERLQEYFKHFDVTLTEGQIAEVNLAAPTWLKIVADKLERGFVIIVDYGSEAKDLYGPGRPKGTLRAFQRHEFVSDLLSDPGAYDITASVNWTDIRQTSASVGLAEVLFDSQDRFLLRAGLLDELETLTRGVADQGEKAQLALEAREMILPGGMSESFSVLVLSKGI